MIVAGLFLALFFSLDCLIIVLKLFVRKCVYLFKFASSLFVAFGFRLCQVLFLLLFSV